MSPQPPRMVVESLGGLGFSAKTRGHEAILDQPLEDGGEDRGMTPSEFFIASLGACIGVYIAIFCQRHKIPYKGMKIEKRR